MQILNTVSSFSNLTDPAQLMTGSAISMLLSLADFIFMIVLGCIAGKEHGDNGDPAQRYNSMSVTLREADDTLMSSTDDSFDDANARAMDNYRRTGSAVPGQGGSAPAPEVRARPAMPPRAAGFGRKAV